MKVNGRVMASRWQTLGLVAGVLLVGVLDTACGKKAKRKRGGDISGGTEIGPEVEVDTGVKQVETGNNEVTTNIVFKASGDLVDGRYATEYLMVVRASEESSIRLKMSPVEKFESTADTEAAQKSGSHSSSNPNLRLTANDDVARDHMQQYNGSQLASMEFLSGPRKSFGLAAPSLCSSRLFRMKGKGMYPTVSKLGRLVYETNDATNKVRVWVDEEVGNMCRGGSTPASLARHRFTHMESPSDQYYDQLKMEIIASVHDQTRQALKQLTDTFGGISDVDGGGALDLFISPDVNRHYTMPFDYYANIDKIQPYPVHRPEDLAAYDPSKNPTSNESEVVYLWAPDAAGLWSKGRTPSSNSLSSNFAKGFAGAQIMSLILSNYRLLKRKNPEELWLVDALTLLGASYVGGNDFPFEFLTNYLSSRPQAVSLTSNSPESYSLQEILGMRTMFGWYLHARTCGTSVAPCAGLKALLDTDKAGTANIEAFTKETFKKTIQNFGLSIGTHLVDDPTIVRAFWNAPTADMPDKPVEMPSLQEVNASDRTKIRMMDNKANVVAGPVDDKTVAGPFPSYEMLIFQPLLPDNELDIKLAKDSVTPIIVTGMVSLSNDVTAALGKQLNVTFIPLGNRNKDLRQIYQEKLSELGHVDQRSINLTGSASPRATVASFNDATFITSLYPDTSYSYTTQIYQEAPEASEDLSVNEARELWIFGSIDNFSVREMEAERTVNDVDAYSIEINPCATTGCPSGATPQDVIVQMYSRDYEKQLKPMFLVTTTDRGKFRGHVASPPLMSLDPDEAARLGTLYSSTDYTYKPVTCEHDNVTIGTCATGGIPGQTRVDHTLFSTGRFGTTYDNFLYSGPHGFPRLNNNMITHDGAPDRDPSFAFIPEETNRQFFDFNFIKDNPAFLYEYFAIPPGISGNSRAKALSGTQIGDLYNVMTYINSLDAGNADPVGGPPDYFMESCKAIGVTEAFCYAPWSHSKDTSAPIGTRGAIDAQVAEYLDNTAVVYRAYCYYSATNVPCGRNIELQALVAGGTIAGPYMYDGSVPANSNLPIVVKVGKTGVTRSTWYVPASPIGSGTCSGRTVVTAPQTGTCNVDSNSLMLTGDIRHQFDLTTSELREGCYASGGCLELAPPVYAFYDKVSYEIETDTDKDRVFITATETIDGALDRTALGANFRTLNTLSRRKGEVVAKEELFHSIGFKVSASGGKIQILAGGRDMTQGKYLIRVRVKKYN